MPSWGGVLQEIADSAAANPETGPDLDGIRLKYLKRLHEHTGRPVIVYASGWLQKPFVQGVDPMVNPIDVHGMMEVCHSLPRGGPLDLLLHSPGGFPSAAEQIMEYLRTRFDEIRAIVPLQAKSAASMMALGCDEIVMGAHSELGPIDPQISVPVPHGQRYSPAFAILADFERAKKEISEDVNSLAAWTPILNAYVGGLLDYCTQQIELSQEVVIGWLQRYMLMHDDIAIAKKRRKRIATIIAEQFGSELAYKKLHDHARPIRIESLEKIKGLRIERLEADHDLQDHVLSIFHCLDFTFNMSSAIKIIETHSGVMHVRAVQQIIAQQPAQQ